MLGVFRDAPQPWTPYWAAAKPQNVAFRLIRVSAFHTACDFATLRPSSVRHTESRIVRVRPNQQKSRHQTTGSDGAQNLQTWKTALRVGRLLHCTARLQLCAFIRLSESRLLCGAELFLRAKNALSHLSHQKDYWRGWGGAGIPEWGSYFYLAAGLNLS